MEWEKVGRETAQSDRIKRSNEHRVVNYLAGDGKGQRWDKDEGEKERYRWRHQGLYPRHGAKTIKLRNQ